MYPNQDAIFERLEATKRFGLLSDYLVRWTGSAGRLCAKVTVWGRAGTPEDVVRHYIARLLKGLMPGRHLSSPVKYLSPALVAYRSGSAERCGAAALAT